jgi:hypothetical protein
MVGLQHARSLSRLLGKVEKQEHPKSPQRTCCPFCGLWKLEQLLRKGYLAQTQ